MSLFNESEAISRIALLEYRRTFYNPLILIVGIFLLIIAILNGIGSHYMFQYFEGEAFDVVTRVGLNNIFDITSQICTIAAMFIGVISTIGDRNDNMWKVILTKPLYIRDVIIGKYLGISAFTLTLVFAVLMACSLLEWLFYGLPGSMSEYLLRMCTFVLILFLECSIVAGVAMFIGIILKNLLDSIAITLTLFFIDWYGGTLTDRIGPLYNLISPMHIYFYTFNGGGNFLVTDTTIPYISWLNASLPYIVLMLLEILVILAVNCTLSIRMEE